ncbi:MAG: UvrD-helicase domain-containing protein [Actinomycetota bacterium]|nr:UvrD-helicase domain-containing protein [Actinomycetota bacterium]
MDKIKCIPSEWEELVNDNQKGAIEHIYGPLLIIAGAGSGKTRVLTYRYAHLVKSYSISFENILAITFTNKAANEMKERISKLLNLEVSPKWISTFHSSCVKILRIHGHLIGFKNNFTIYDQSDSAKLIRNCMRDNDVDLKQYSPKRFQAHISSLKNMRISPGEAVENAESFFEVKVAEIYTSYEKKLILSNSMDFDDLLIKTVELLETNDQALDYWSNKFEYIMVDEYQDTNLVQYKLIELLSSKHKNLCVVGDSDQSIYAFRGADIRNIEEFEKDFSNAKIITLEKNYRSSQKILDIANSVISNNPRKKEKNLWTDNEDGVDVNAVRFNSERDEGRWIGEEISKIINDDERSEIAIFYRTNNQSRIFEEELRKLSINYRVVGNVRFYDRKEIKDILSYLNFLVNQDDAVSFERVLNVPKRGIGESTLQKLREYANSNNISVSNVLDHLKEIDTLSDRVIKQLNIFKNLIIELKTYAIKGPAQSIEKILELTGYRDELIKEGTLESQMRIENLEELLTSAMEFENLYEEEIDDPFHKVRDYLESLALFTDSDNITKEDNVLLMTLHNAKGLEFPIVFMTGMEENVFPSQKSENEFEIQEERRLCYVGMTRAEKKLYLTYSSTRTLWAGTNYNLPSRFLDEGRPFFKELEVVESNNSDSLDPQEDTMGKKVIHEKYGKGIVVETSGNEITIDFGEEWGIKHLDIEWAPIKFE